MTDDHPYHNAPVTVNLREQDALRRVARDLGHPDDQEITAESLSNYGKARFQDIVSSPNRRSVRFIPTPEDVPTRAGTVQVEVPLNKMNLSLATITERGIEQYKDRIRHDLTQSLVHELMQAKWVNVTLEGDKVIATLTIMQA